MIAVLSLVLVLTPKNDVTGCVKTGVLRQIGDEKFVKVLIQINAADPLVTEGSHKCLDET